MLNVHGGEREPFMKGGQEQQMMDSAIIQRENRGFHIVPFRNIIADIVPHKPMT
jgi:hypothetical protein